MRDFTRLNQPQLLWASEITKLGLQLTTIYVLARVIGPVTMGLYLATTAFLFILPRMLDAGLPQAAAYFLRAEQVDPRHLMRLLMRHILFGAPFAYALVFLLGLLPGDEAKNAFSVHTVLLGTYVVTELTTLLIGSLFVPSGRFISYATTNLVAPTLNLAGVVTYPLWAGKPALAPVLALLAISSAVGAMSTLAVFRAGQGEGGRKIDPREYYGYGLRSWGSSFAKVLSMRFDRIVLTALLTPALFSQYSLAVSIRDILVLPSNLFAATLRNTQTDLIVKHHDLDAARHLLRRTAAVWLLFGIAAATILAPFWPAFIKVALGARYADTALFLQGMAFSCAPLSIIGICVNHLYALYQPGKVTLLSCIALVVTPTVFFVCTYLFGMREGALIGALVCSALVGVLNFVVGIRIGPAPRREKATAA